MLTTRFCERFGIDAPIVAAPMGPDLTGPELVAAVCNAGGFGILQAQLCPPALLRQQIRHLRGLTAKPFGVNFVFPIATAFKCASKNAWQPCRSSGEILRSSFQPRTMQGSR